MVKQNLDKKRKTISRRKEAIEAKVLTSPATKAGTMSQAMAFLCQGPNSPSFRRSLS